MTQKRRLGLGLIGTGFMGRTHAFAYTMAPRVFDLPVTVDLVAVADVGEAAAERARAALGFRTATADWRALVADPEIDIVAITAPNTLHREMALAAIAAGRNVHCEKPLAPTTAECEEMTGAAEAAGVATQTGFNYLKNPMLALAKQIVDSGELGEIRTYRGIHAEDFMADADAPWSWRLDPAGGGGAFADIGSHAVATARHLAGPIAELFADAQTLIRERPARSGASERRAVEVDDVTSVLVRFASGAVGSLEANWIATGRTMQHDFAICGSKGGLAFTQERFNELRLFDTRDRPGRRGFRTICAGPEHEPYGAFCVAPGHQLGFNDLKTIEVRDFLLAIAGEPGVGPDFREAWRVQQVVEAVYRSSRERRWLPGA